MQAIFLKAGKDHELKGHWWLDKLLFRVGGRNKKLLLLVAMTAAFVFARLMGSRVALERDLCIAVVHS